MTIIRLNYAQVCLILVAFLTIQWTTSHLHLEQQHSHDGTFHQHQVTAHAHQYLAVNDLEGQSNHSNIIEFDEEYHLQKRIKQQIPSPDMAIEVSHSIVPIIRLKIEIPVYINTNLGYLALSNTKSRAPPLNS